MFTKQITIHHIFSSPKHNYFTRKKFDIGTYETIEHKYVNLKSGSGLLGDRFEFSKYPITFFSLEVVQEIEENLGISIDIKLFRRNIIISNVHLNSLIGKHFFIDGIEFEGLEHCAPCPWMNKAIHSSVYKQMIGRGGLRVKVISSGKLNLGVSELRTDVELNINPLLAKPKINIPS